MKIRLRALTLATALALGLGAPAVWASGIPVVDVAAIAEAIKQYQQMVEQLATLNSQLNQAKQQYESMTGGRGMENLLANETRNAVPASWQESLAMMEGSGEISNLARSIRDQASRVDTATLDQLAPELREMHASLGNSAASEQAVAGTSYDHASQRFARLQQLMDAIPAATDMKAIADLQARVQVEQLMLQNEAIKMQSLAQVAVSQQRIENQQQRDLLLKANAGTEAYPALTPWVRRR